MENPVRGVMTGTQGYNALYATGAWPYTSPVGSFASNGFGLFDMAGNSVERCWDWHGTPYGQPATTTGPVSGSDRVVCGSTPPLPQRAQIVITKIRAWATTLASGVCGGFSFVCFTFKPSMNTHIKNELLLPALITAIGLIVTGSAPAQAFTTFHSTQINGSPRGPTATDFIRLPD